jgi:hypothetical protein
LGSLFSHASEDKETIARPIAQALVSEGFKVWYDEFTLKIGDSLRRSIDFGLARSQYGIVILSPNFFSKEWPQRELDGLSVRERGGKKVILPIWHEIDAETVYHKKDSKAVIPFEIYTALEAESFLRGRFRELCKIVDERLFPK